MTQNGETKGTPIEINDTLNDEVADITAAFGKGRAIQKQSVVGKNPKWEDDPEPTWSWESYKYQITPVELCTIWGVIPIDVSGALNKFTPCVDKLSAVTLCKKNPNGRIVQMMECTNFPKDEMPMHHDQSTGFKLSGEPAAPDGVKPVGRSGVGNVNVAKAGKSWSKEDDTVIIKFHKTAGNAMIGKQLGRSAKSITNRKSKLKLSGKL